MAFINLGFLVPTYTSWRVTALSAINGEEIIKLNFWNPTGNFGLISSRLMVRRRWENSQGIPVVENPYFVYPSPLPSIQHLLISPSLINLGYTQYRVEVRKISRRRSSRLAVTDDIDYSVWIDVG